MDSFIQIWENQWDAYPHWLIMGSLAITAGAGLWFFAKFVAWLFKIILISAVVGLTIGIVIHFLR